MEGNENTIGQVAAVLWFTKDVSQGTKPNVEEVTAIYETEKKVAVGILH